MKVVALGSGIPGLRRELKKLRRRLEDNSAEMNQIGREGVSDVKNNIRQGRGADGKRFERLAESTLNDRRRKGISSRKPMRATGKTERSIVSSVDQRGRSSIVRIGPRTKRERDKLLFNMSDTAHVRARAPLGVSRKLKTKSKQISIKEMKRDIRKAR